jgi:T5SS/PEP-CTERM-associated repeat protein
LLLTNGGSLSSAAAFLGFNSTSTSNSVFVANANSVLRIGGFLGVGNSGGGNELRISNGGLVTNASVNIGFNSSASNNLVRVTDAGSTWITAGLLVGFQGVGNQVIVENGAHLVGTGTAQLGSGAFGNSNSVLVTGSGSLWTNTGTIIVGVNSAANTLIVSNAGTIYGSALTIGSASSSTNNRCVVNGATLRVTNANSTATIDIRRGTNRFNSGLIEADQLLVTNTLGFFEFNGGTLNVRTSIVANAQTFFAGDGTNAATLNLLGTGAHSFTNGLTIRSNALFTGNGTINATLTAQSGGVVFPSAGPSAPGALFLKGNLSLQSNSVFRVVLNGTSPGSGYSQLTLTNGNLTLGLNSPTLELVTSFTPAIGDSFIILQNQTFFGRSGDFKGLPEGTTFTNSGFLFQISYQGGSGNDVTVTRVAPPPPPLPAIPISAGSYAQDFNTLSGDGFSSNPWSNATTLPGWYASQSASPFDIGNYHSNNGGDTTGALYSYGAASSGERALGSLSSGTVGTIGFGLCFTNDTGHAVSNCTVSYTGEQWRCGGNGSVTNTLTFWYRVSPSVITDPDPASNTGWTAVTGLNFVSPTVLTNAGALDGNQPTNQHSFVMVAVPGFSVPAGQNVFFRWLDINDTGFDQGIAVDNFSVAFVARALGFSALYSNPTNKFVQLTGQGDANTMYVIEAASNLNFPIFWQRLGSNLTDGTGFLQFTDTNAPQFQNRFYRALSP